MMSIYLEVDNGSEWEQYFSKGVQERKFTLVHNCFNSLKVNTFVERVKGAIQSEYLYRFYEETGIGRINKMLYDCLIE